MTFYLKKITESPGKTIEEEVLLSDSVVFGELFQNTSLPEGFVVSHLVDTPWNATNAGAIIEGAYNGVIPTASTGELPIDEDGDYEVTISGSVKSTNPDVPLCAVLFADEVMVLNVCDFPTTRSDDNYLPFMATGIRKDAIAGEKLSVRFKALGGTTETIQLRTMNFKHKKIK